MPRHVQLRSGIPMERPVLGINRLCGSGFQSIVNASQVNPNSFYNHQRSKAIFLGY